MNSFNPPKQTFSPKELKMLDLALVGALATTAELGLPRRGFEGALRRRLFVIASTGITEPAELRDETLKDMNIDRIAN